jgi:hypothetical protein
MIRLGTIGWLLLVASAGFAMFEVKYTVMGLEDRLGHLDRAIQADEESIHVLNAEWAYLSKPARLDELQRRYLNLAPISTKQLGQIDSLPMRPSALPPAAPGPQADATGSAAARSRFVQ